MRYWKKISIVVFAMIFLSSFSCPAAALTENNSDEKVVIESGGDTMEESGNEVNEEEENQNEKDSPETDDSEENPSKNAEEEDGTGKVGMEKDVTGENLTEKTKENAGADEASVQEYGEEETTGGDAERFEEKLESENPGGYAKVTAVQLRSAATSTLQVAWQGSLGAIDPELLDLNDPYNVSIKFVDTSDTNNIDMRGKRRMVYCIQYQHDAPSGQINWNGSGNVSPSIAYLMYWGCRYWGQECIWSGYRTGYGWKYDCLATQYAVHITNGEFSLNTLYSHLKGPKKEHFYSIVKTMVDDSKNASYYNKFADGWRTFKYSLSDSSVKWTETSYNGKEGFATKWITQHLSDGETDCSEYIRSRSVTVNHGATVIWKDSGESSAFRIWISKAKYLQLQTTGGTVKATISGTHPQYLAGWVYKSTNPDKYQMVTLLEGSGSDAEHKKSVTAAIPKKDINCYIDLQKKDKETGQTTPQGTAEFYKAVYQVTDKDGNVVAKMTTDKKGKASSTALPVGTFSVKEITPPKGYDLDKTVHKVTFKNTDIDQKVYRIDVSSEEPPKKGTVSLKKISAESKKPLENAVFCLYDSKDKMLGEYKTDRDGYIKVENLIWGSYYFSEKQAPEGFLLSKEPIMFEVNDKTSEQVIELTEENNVKRVTLTIEKEINAGDINYANGTPFFVFKVSGEDINGKIHVWNRILGFPKNYVEQNKTSQGTVRNKVVFEDLPAGIYKAEELKVMRYSLQDIIEIENGTRKENAVEFTLIEKDFGRAVFVNKKDEWGDWSDTAFCENVIPEKKEEK